MQIYSSYGSKEREPWGGREREGAMKKVRMKKENRELKEKYRIIIIKTEGQSEREREWGCCTGQEELSVYMNTVEAL